MNTAPLTECVEQELRLTERLLEVLREEESMLLANEIDSLPASTQSKSKLVAEFFVLRQRRLTHLAQLGLPAEDASMVSWLERHADDAIRPLWARLLDRLATAKELNRTNGLLIHQLSVRNRSALQALQAHDSPRLYGRYDQGGRRSTFTVLG